MVGIPDRLADLPSYVIYILFNPALNPKAALIVYAGTALVLLLILAVGFLILTRPEGHVESVVDSELVDAQDEDQPFGDETDDELTEDSAVSDTVQVAPPSRPVKVVVPPLSTRARWIVAGLSALALVAIWVAAGYTTSNPAVCKNCHWPSAQHAQAEKGADPHASVSCVSCHEPGGIVGRYVTGVPARLVHFVDSQSEAPRPAEYGRITTSACSACHRSALKGIANNETRGLKISHSEPMAASAACTDCHMLSAGVVGPHNAGMAPCLGCHDSVKASSKCATCHDENVAAAARARTASFTKEQIPDVSCGGCHDEKKECDWCHGVRLPHSTEFKSYAHSRAGAVDFWYNGGKTCARCHNAKRRPCQQCHGVNMGKNHGVNSSWMASGHQAADPRACDSCHKQFAYVANRDFCKDLCHTPAAIAASPR